MSFPTKAERKACWDSRDKLWECLEAHNVKENEPCPKECVKFRKMYESSCPTQWIAHFDRKYNYNVFKKKMESGYDPVKEANK